MIVFFKNKSILYDIKQIYQLIIGFIIFHIIIATIVLTNDFPFLFLLNMFFICCNLLALIFIKKEKLNFCIYMVFFLVLFYTTVFLYYFGWDYGFYYFTLPITCYCYLVSEKKIWLNYLVALFGCIYNISIMYLFCLHDYSLNYDLFLFSYDLKFAFKVIHGSIVSICFILISNMLRAQRLEDLESREAINSSLDKNANIDYLTGLKNRWYFIEGIEDLEVTNNVNLAIIDIDFFKKVNDTYGHSAGDEVLKTCANLLVAKFGKHTDLICRWGGEEFLIFVYNMEQDDFIKICEEFRVEYEQNTTLELNIKSSVSIGALYIDKNFASNILDEYIVKVDECLYQAKNLGRNRIVKK